MISGIKGIDAYRDVARMSSHKDRDFLMKPNHTDTTNTKDSDHEDQTRSSFDKILRQKMKSNN